MSRMRRVQLSTRLCKGSLKDKLVQLASGWLLARERFAYEKEALQIAWKRPAQKHGAPGALKNPKHSCHYGPFERVDSRSALRSGSGRKGGRSRRAAPCS
jgi:hypothetical protein